MRKEEERLFSWGQVSLTLLLEARARVSALKDTNFLSLVEAALKEACGRLHAGSCTLRTPRCSNWAGIVCAAVLG